MDSIVYMRQEPRGPSELVEIPVTINGSMRIPIPDVQQLRSTVDQKIIIKGIRLVPPIMLTNGIINNNVNAPITEAVKCVLVLYSQGWEKGHYIPLTSLNDCSSNTVPTPGVTAKTYFDNWKNVDWSKSFVLFGNGTGGAAGVPYVFMLDVEYIKLDADNKLIEGAS